MSDFQKRQNARFQKRRKALYAEFPQESAAYEAEFNELQAKLAEVERERDALRDLLEAIHPFSSIITSTGYRSDWWKKYHATISKKQNENG